MIAKRVLLVGGTFLLSVLLYIDRVCISAAETPITADLGLSKEQFSWVLSAFALGYALCQTPAGWLADRLGPRRILTAVVIVWSLFTGWTAAAKTWIHMLIVRFLFGAGEAGAFPGIARATFSWIPMAERGIVQGINFSGSRLGAAFAYPLVAWMIGEYGWQRSFVILMFVGFAWAVFWFFWFRDDPADHPRITKTELDHILQTRQQQRADTDTSAPLTLGSLLGSADVWLVSTQYFCCNFTFFFCLTWLYPHVKSKFTELGALEAAIYAGIPLCFGALGNWFAGWLVDRIYRAGRWTLSRRLPAIVGYVLAALGLIVSVYMESAAWSIVWLSVAIFGADMTLAPSWSFCIDIGRHHAGLVSGTMNMAGNIGSALSPLAFAYLESWTGTTDSFFFAAAVLNAIAIVLWLFATPDRQLEGNG